MGRRRQAYSIYKRTGGATYLVQFRDEAGKRFTRDSGKSNKTEAFQWAEAFVAARPAEQAAKAKAEEDRRVGIPLGEWLGDTEAFWFGRFLVAKRARGFRAQEEWAASAVQRTRDYILPAFGSIPISKLSVELIDQWVLRWYAAGTHSGQTINHALNTLRTILDFAVTDKLLVANPARAVRRVALNSRERGWLTRAEVSRLLAAETWSPEQATWRAAVALAALTGIRRSELAALRWGNFRGNYFVVADGWSWMYSRSKGTTKSGKLREVPVSDGVLDLLDRHAELLRLARAPGDLVFPALTDPTKPPSADRFNSAFRSALTRIGIDEAEQKERNLVWHSLRHTAISLAVAQNTSTAKLKAAVGHGSDSVLSRYTHLQADAFDELLGIQEQLLPKEESRAVAVR